MNAKDKPKARPLSRLVPEAHSPQDTAVETAADEPTAVGTSTASKPARQLDSRPAPKPVVTTKRTFRWSVEDDRELQELLDEFNRSLPPGAKRLRMEHVGRAMRKLFVNSNVSQLLKQAHKEVYDTKVNGN